MDMKKPMMGGSMDAKMMDMCDQMIAMAQKMKGMMSGEDQTEDFSEEMSGTKPGMMDEET